MKQKAICAIVLLTMLAPEFLMAQAGTQQVATARPQPPATAVAAPAPNPPQNTQGARPQSASRRRSYERETRVRRGPRISKKEVIFLAGIAGTSMGIGALAGGAKGLAIGAIVGGWGAYAAHRFWRWIR